MVIDISERKQQAVILRCSCAGQCGMIVVDKNVYPDEEANYSITFQDSRYDHNNNTLFGRIKQSCKVLFGKPIYYSDVYIENPQKFADFVKELNGLVEVSEKPLDEYS